VSTSISTTISDPDGVKGTGDETATSGTFGVVYADQHWTAHPAVGNALPSVVTAQFREHSAASSGGHGILVIVQLQFGGLHLLCSPGTVDVPLTGVATLFDPPPFASTTIQAAPTGQRAAAVKKCKKKFPRGSKKRKRCIKKAKKLPV
jgi:hypothetical protein